jgi:hypothetical protein
MSLQARYPELVPYLDDTDDYENEATEFAAGGNRFVVITQRGEIDSSQLVFREDDTGWQLLDADTTIDVLETTSERRGVAAALGVCNASNNDDHRAVAREMVSQVDRFSSVDGPDRGNLACVWTVRHIAFRPLQRWITRTDGTSVFDAELQQCYGATHQEADVGEGGIIISPTESIQGRRNVGHVGLLGPNTGDGNRRIYSNSSSAAVWKQNFTLQSWIARYRDRKGLKIRFYPLPNRTSGSV